MENKFLPINLVQKGKQWKKHIYNTYEINMQGKIRKIKTKKEMGTKNNGQTVSFYLKELGQIGFSVFKLALFSFHPVAAYDDIDFWDYTKIVPMHIDQTLPKQIGNVWWGTKSEHSSINAQNRKGTVCKGRRKKVQLVEVKGEGNKDLEGMVFEDRYAVEDKLPGVKPHEVRNSIQQGFYAQRKYRFEYFVEEIEGEVWVPFIDFKTGKEHCQVSNKGRIRTKKGKVWTGYKAPKKSANSAGRSVVILKNHTQKQYWDVSQVVWVAFNKTPIPKGKLILHDDENDGSRNPDGYYRNWLEDLRIGDQKENMQDYRKREKRLRDEADDNNNNNKTQKI